MIRIYMTYLNKCNIMHMIGELRRFGFHIILIHLISIIIQGKSVYDDFFIILLVTLLSITIYHIFIKKLVEPSQKKMKNICKMHKYN
jgi:hypothetical protein